MKNLKYVTMASVLLLQSCALFSTRPEKAFLAKSEEIIELLGTEAKADTPARLNKLSLELLELAKPLVAKQKDLYPDCVEFLTKIENDLPKMKGLSLDQIENDYHAGEALPESPEHCYEGKELLVHPATVYIISKGALDDTLRERAQNEIIELIAHFELIAK